jgi:hypothetical protein
LEYNKDYVAALRHLAEIPVGKRSRQDVIAKTAAHEAWTSAMKNR